jgi:hypothetical protein
MARKQVTLFIDDITGQEASDGATHTFSLNGVQYEIDLAPDTYDEMADAFGPYIKAARKVGASRRRRSPRVPHEGPSAGEVRQWAKDNGYEVNERGRVPAEVRQAYDAAH